MSNPSEITHETSQQAAHLDTFDIDQVKLRVRPQETETVTLQLPKTVLTSLEKVSLKRSVSSVKALIRLYISKGLRQDLSQLFSEQMSEQIMDATAQVLTRRLGSEEAAAEAMQEIRQTIAATSREHDAHNS